MGVGRRRLAPLWALALTLACAQHTGCHPQRPLPPGPASPRLLPRAQLGPCSTRQPGDHAVQLRCPCPRRLMRPGAQPPVAARLPGNQEPACTAQAEAAPLGAPWTHLRDKARFLGRPLGLLRQSLGPQLALSPSGPQLSLEGLSQHGLRVCPSDGLLLAGLAQSSTAELSFKHPDLPPVPQGPGGTALRGVTIHPPLRTTPVVRGETAGLGRGRAAVSAEIWVSRAGGGGRVRGSPRGWGPGFREVRAVSPVSLGNGPLCLTAALNAAHGGRVCSTWGDFHYKTFDGDVFRFPGLCNYVFSAHCGSAYEDFNLQLRRSPGPNSTAPSMVTMKLDGLVVRLAKGSVLVNGHPIQLPFSQSGVLIDQSNGNLRVVAKLGLVFMWNQDDSLLLELDAKYTNQTCGLCGDFNGVPVYNEFFSHNVKLTPTEFGNLQKMDGPTEQCQDPVPEDAGTCSNNSGICEEMLSSEPFLGCALLVNASSYLEACRHDLCHCSQASLTSCLCHTLAEYSRQCAHAGGLPLDWRGPQLCPQTCPLNMRYHECGSPCVDTCSNPEHSQLCEDHCMAGCFCPEGMVLDDIGHTGCIPVSGCSCMYNGATYAPGTGYSTDCTNCTCSGGQWTCREAPCPGTCSVLGGAHISTFDEKQYTVHGDCSYVLAKPCDSGAFTVLAELRRCGLTDSESCLKSLTLSLGGGHTVFMIKASGEVFMNQVYIQLPVSAANVTLFRPSTFFIIAQTQLGLQLDIQLVPIMQVFVRLEPQIRGQTCGLCGNFNQNQADDFRTISGVVEGSAAAFANTWKTQAACPNIKNSFEDPCSLSVENEKFAQHWCSRLTDPQGSFAQCHSAVDPSAYYSNCMFDTCNCEKSEDCLCAALSSYVRACAARGVLLGGWRDGVCTKAMATCPKSLTYRYNISTCPPTCQARSDEDVTCGGGFVPVDGCTCPDGTFLDNMGACVPAASCPCYFQGSVVPNGESRHEQGTVCSCTQGALTCIGGHTPDQVCVPPMVYFDCRNATPGASGAGCQKSCQTLDMDCYSPKCEPGCVCPDGLVASGDGGCVPVSDCPCVHNEASYQPGQTIRIGCNTCTCRSRTWQCTDQPCLATCAVYGDGHYLTFDGRDYSFSGDCEYTLLQDHCGGNSSAQDSFRVITENVPCGTTGTTCSKAIKIFLGSYELKLSDRKLEVIETGPRPPYSIRQMGIYLVVDTEVGLVLLWDKGTSIFLRLSPEFKGRVCGLCGNFDDNALNDFTTRSQSVVGDVLEFGNSWKFSPSCPDALAPGDPCTANPYRKSWAQKQCSIINSATFSACHAHVEPSKYYKACVSDACACNSGGDCECFCTAVAAYAQACHDAGVCVSWRTPDICPLFCDYYNPQGQCEWHYLSCGAPCLKTCRNPSGQCWHDTRGLEGCYPKCPPEAPIFDEDQMQCVASCPTPSPPPTCHAGGQSFWPGSKVPSDRNCYSCICTEDGVQCVYAANACVCTYGGKQFHPGDEIYRTTDGLGSCILARCGANGTIERLVYPCSPTTPTPQTIFSFSTSLPERPSTEPTTVTTVTCLQVLCNWTEWMDGSYPGPGRNSGDFDTIPNLRAEGYKFCAEPKNVQCRAERFPDTPLQELGQDVICNKSVGLICRNEDQLPPICYNYNVRFLCCELVDTCRTHTISPATPATIQTAPTEASTTWTTGTLSTSNKLSTASSPHVTTARPVTTSTHEQSSPGTTPCKPKCRWTKWFDVDFPMPGPHGGDNETFGNILRNGDLICHRPESISKVECRAESHHGVSIHELGQVVQCRQDMGLLCRNQDQKGETRTCLNYEIRVLCCEPQEHCPPPTVTGASTTRHHNLGSYKCNLCASKEHNVGSYNQCKLCPDKHHNLSSYNQCNLCAHKHHNVSSYKCNLCAAKEHNLGSYNQCNLCSHKEHNVSSYKCNLCADKHHNLGSYNQYKYHLSSYKCNLCAHKHHNLSSYNQCNLCADKHHILGSYNQCHLCADKHHNLGSYNHGTSVPTSETTPSLPGTTPCKPKCRWTKWFDADFPMPGPHGGDNETFGNILRNGDVICHRPESISKVECRAESHHGVSIHELGQVVQCRQDMGLLCRNQDQKGDTRTCLNYEIRVLCCEPQEHCPPPTVTGASTTRCNLCADKYHYLGSYNQCNLCPDKRHNLGSYNELNLCAQRQHNFGSYNQWTKWFDTDFPMPGPHGGDNETFGNILRNGDVICHRSESISKVECRAESHQGVSIHELGQVVQCRQDMGLLCRNQDQKGETRMCLNYEIRVLCCEPQEHCPPPTVTGTSTTRCNLCAHKQHILSSYNQCNLCADKYHLSSYKCNLCAHKHHNLSSYNQCNLCADKHHILGSYNQCHLCSDKHHNLGSYNQWTKWFDADFPMPGPHGGDNETFGNILRNGDVICHRPESISKVECRAESHHGVSIHELGQVVQCRQDMGLLCRNQDQKGDTRTCLNYEIRVLCCEPQEHCPPPTVTGASTTRCNLCADKYHYLGSYNQCNLCPDKRHNLGSYNELNLCAQRQHNFGSYNQWTKWFDTDFPMPGPHGGDNETFGNILRNGDVICHRSESISKVECRAESHQGVSIHELGQVVQCRQDMGLLCRNQDQKGETRMCLNYEIRVLCCEPQEHCPPPTVTGTSTTRFNLCAHKEHNLSSYKCNLCAAKEHNLGSYNQCNLCAHKEHNLNSYKCNLCAAKEHNLGSYNQWTTPCKPKCRWTKWFDADFPMPGPHGGDNETFGNILRNGDLICHRPESISKVECRAESHHGVSIHELGQVVQCRQDMGLLCRNQDQKGETRMCLNYEIRVLCCEPQEHCPPPTITGTSTTRCNLCADKYHYLGSYNQCNLCPDKRHNLGSYNELNLCAQRQHNFGSYNQWTKWFDADFPMPGPHGGDNETFGNILRNGDVICHRPESISKVECRAESHHGVSIHELGQVVQCRQDMGLLCRNQDQKGDTRTCLNYEIRVLCCEPQEHCPPPTVTGASTTRCNLCADKYHYLGSYNQCNLCPDKRHNLGSYNELNLCAQRQHNFGSYNQWTKWFDTDFPMPGPHGGDNETFGNILRNGDVICHRSESISKVECRAESHQGVSIHELGQVVQCRQDMGLLCRNQDQKGETRMCLNYEIRVLCCEPQEHCPPPTVTGTSTTRFNLCAHKEHNLSSYKCNLCAAKEHNLGSYNQCNLCAHKEHNLNSYKCNLCAAKEHNLGSYNQWTTPCKPKCRWTKWFDADFPMPGPHGGDNETFGNILRNGDLICHRPESISKVECRAESHHGVSIHELGQVVQCRQDMGLLCRNQDQKGETRMCLNYEIRVLCCEPQEHCPPPTITGTSTTRCNLCADKYHYLGSYNQCNLCPDKRHNLGSYNELNLCAQRQHNFGSYNQWTKWFDTDFPMPGPHGGDNETFGNILRNGDVICHRPESISKVECRAESHHGVSIHELGQVVQCRQDMGLLCQNQDQKGEIRTCLNYEIRVLCCEPQEHCPPPTVTGTSTTRCNLCAHKEHNLSSYKCNLCTAKEHNLGSYNQCKLCPDKHHNLGSYNQCNLCADSATSLPTSLTTPLCYCNASGTLYPPGSIIYEVTDLSGYCYYAFCSLDCHVVKQMAPSCPTSMPPPTPTTSPPESSPSASVSVPSQGCPNAVPPRTKGETWPMPNCSEATCQGNGVITVSPRHCPKVQKPTCANGYPAVQVADHDSCCSHYHCPCVCSGWGDPHYITFDGTYYTFLDNCTYVLVQQIVPVYGHFRVLVENYFCDAKDGLSCPQSIIVEYQENRVVLTHKAVRGVMTNEIIFNGEVVRPGFQKDGIAVSQVGIKMYVSIPELGVQVMFSGLIFSVEVPFSKFANNTEGQCGTCTNDQKDDCRLPGGAVVASCSDMSGHWKVTYPGQPPCNGHPPTPTPVEPRTSPTPCPPSPICQLILSKPFELCHALIPPWPYYQGCTFDQCHMPGVDVVCSALELYAARCASLGVCVDWRAQTNYTCPFTCLAGMEYRPCGPPTPSYCCMDSSTSAPALLGASPITEGCFCPQGMMFYSSSKEVCVPADCNTCLGPSGEPVEPGHTVSVDCQECTCEGSTRTMSCRPQACPLAPTCPESGHVPMPEVLQTGQCCPQYHCACNTSHCPEPEACPKGSHAIQTYSEAACCPTYSCSWSVCSINGTLYQVRTGEG
ncbi:mucin-5AC-like [Dama dama]